MIYKAIFSGVNPKELKRLVIIVDEHVKVKSLNLKKRLNFLLKSSIWDMFLLACNNVLGTASISSELQQSC